MLTSASRAAARRVLSSSGQSVRFAHRAFILRRALPSVRMISISASTRMPATVKPKTKSASASKKPATKKSATTKKTTAKSKPMPKVKAESKPRAKTPEKKKTIKKHKKELTPEEKEKSLLRELKKVALLNGPKHLAESSWSVFIANNIPKGTTNFGEKVKSVASDFKNLSASEKERLQEIAKSKFAAKKDAHKAWMESYPPEAIYMANNARRRLARKLEKSRVFLLHDDRLPRRALTPYTLFIKDRFQSGGGPVTDAIRTLSQEWKALSEADRGPYTEQAAAEAKKSKEELKVLREKGKEYWKAQLAEAKSK